MVKPKAKKGKSKAAKHATQRNADKAHEPENKQSMKQSTDFLALSDHCLLEIFKYLPLNDVCSLSQTCRRMHALGSSHFMLNHKAKVMVFVDWLYGNLFTFPRVNQEKYIECFAKSMRSVTLLRHFSTIAAMEQLNEFYQKETKAEAEAEAETAPPIVVGLVTALMKKVNSFYQRETEAEVASPIEAIRFAFWKVAVSKAHCNPIAAILKNVKSVTFENTSINADLDGCLFGFMPNLKRLTVLDFTVKDPGSVKVSYNSIWMQPPCPTLEYFAWHTAPKMHEHENDFSVTEMVRFLKMNPGIKFVSLRLESQSQLTILTTTGIQVNELFFTIIYRSFAEWEAEIAEIVKDLKDFCEKQVSMKVVNDDQRIRLHLKICGNDFEKQPGQLELLAPYIVGLYFEDYIQDCFAAVFPKLINLKVLQAKEIVPAELLCRLPNLEEVFVSCSARPLSYYDDAIRILGSRLPKLKKLYLNGYSHRSVRNLLFSGGDMMEQKEDFKVFATIDTKRKKLTGAQKMKVFLEVEQNLRDEKVDYDTVEVLRTQTEAITNPFFEQSHLVDSVAAPDPCVIM
ncbi:uncharacterized protein LOC129574731 [Sitodiplosis mosellana]|uniref:uncharacterized protein LOC129574731 n=1 Tax=Sitodiplosis mosellana TaxID=263140 RepID=UPI002444B0E0|nr:uncharacterized protein LOC129574731 [Sitodiplosis mosellana]